MPNKCDFCAKSYTRKSSLKKHLVRKHIMSPNKNFKCYQCSKEFDSQKSIYFHIQKDHNENNLTFQKQEHSFGEAINVYKKSLISEKSNVQHFCDSESTVNEIFKVIKKEFEDQPSFKVSVSLSANYSINDSSNEEKKDNELIVLRGKSNTFVKFDTQRKIKGRIYDLLQQVKHRESEFEESGSGWQFDQLFSCDVLIYKVNTVPVNTLDNLQKK